jgi:hypothetical protein
MQRLADNVGVYPPKTIHGGGLPTSGGVTSSRKRGRGAPPGNLNALKTGRFTRKARILRKQTWAITSRIDAVVRLVEASYGLELRFGRRRKQNWPVIPDELRWIYRKRARE